MLGKQFIVIVATAFIGGVGAVTYSWASWATNTLSGCNQGPSATGIYTSPTWTWTYPVAFDSTPIIQTTVGGGHYNHLSSRGNGNSTSATINTWDRSSNSYDQGVYALAIGTWS